MTARLSIDEAIAGVLCDELCDHYDEFEGGGCSYEDGLVDRLRAAVLGAGWEPPLFDAASEIARLRDRLDKVALDRDELRLQLRGRARADG